ncbi:14260_t:CDS:2, partial [Gigaspora margarita]
GSFELHDKKISFYSMMEEISDFFTKHSRTSTLQKFTEQLSGEEAEKCLANFEVKYNQCLNGLADFALASDSGLRLPSLADFALASDSGLRLSLGALTFYYLNKNSLSVDNFWKTVDKKLHENEIELENLDYAKHALKDTNNETQLIRAVTINRTIGLLKHGLESQDEKSEGIKFIKKENYQHGKSSSPLRTSEHSISSSSLFVPLTTSEVTIKSNLPLQNNFDANKRDPKNFTLDEFVDENDAPVRTPEQQISSSSSSVPLATRSESDVEETDCENFDTNKRDPKNFTFDEFVDGNDEYVDDMTM